jgi:dienelactone hydrolase
LLQKESLEKLLGPWPQKAPLDPLIIESVDCGLYVREKVTYNVEPNERIAAYILVPKNRGEQKPAIFCHHQHASNFDLGKSEVVGLAGDPDQAYAAELAERGYITFAPDAIAFEERNWSSDPGHAEYFELATRLVQGSTLLAKVLHDVSVGLDYLQSRSDVDAGRIGFIGHSYGGRMAIWAPAFDQRIQASVSNCGCINYKDSRARDVGIQMEFCVQGIMQTGDIEDVVTMIEPRALLISATDNDKWSRGARAIYDYAKPSFKKGSLDLKIWPGKHVFTKEMRNAAYAFLDTNLRPNLHQT